MKPELTFSLQFADPRHRPLLPRHKVMRWVRAALEAPGEITVRIVGAEEAQTLNRDYREKDYATNVLTFDYSQEPVVCADLVICAEVVEQEAKGAGKDVAAHYARTGPVHQGRRWNDRRPPCGGLLVLGNPGRRFSAPRAPITSTVQLPAFAWWPSSRPAGGRPVG